MKKTKRKVEKKSVKAPFRIGYVFLVPVVFVAALYLALYLSLNSRRGSEFLAEQISSLLGGELEYAYLEVGPNLTRVDLYDVRLDDPSGRPAIEVRHIGCDFNPSALLINRIWLDSCVAEDGRLSVFEGAGGTVGLVAAVSGSFRQKRRRSNPPRIMFTNVTLSRVDVLIQLRDMSIRFDGLSLEDGEVEVGREEFVISASATIDGGRLMMSERLFNLGDGKPSWDVVQWEMRRQTRPWAVAHEPVPETPDGAPAVLDVPFGQGRLDDFRWSGDAMTFRRFVMDSTVASVDASGFLQLTPERPKLPYTERGILWYDGRMTVAVYPDAPIFDFFVPGLIEPSPSPDRGRPGIEPLRFDGYGNLRFYQGAETELYFQNMDVLGWRLDEFFARIRIADGIVEMFPDAYVRMWAGELSGGGQLRTADGTWELGLCANDLRLPRIVAPFLETEGTALDALLDVDIRTTPAVCEPEAAPGIELWGDLTTKAIERAPAATTPEDKEIQAPMINLEMRGLRLDWRRPTGVLPWTRARIDAGASLDQRGRVTFESSDGPGLRVRAGQELFTFSGELDTLESSVSGGRVRLSTPSLTRWLRVAGVPSPPEGLSMRTNFQIDGPLADPVLSDIRLELDKPDRDALYPDFRASGTLQADGERLIVDGFDISSSVAEVRVAGTVGLFGGSVLSPVSNPTFDLDFLVPELSLGQLAPQLGVSTTIATRFRLGGSLRSPSVEGSEFEALGVVALDEPVDYVSLESYSLSNRRIELWGIDIIKGKGRLTGDLQLDLAEGTIDLDVHGREFLFREFLNLDATGLDLRGEAAFDIGVHGPLTSPDIEGRLTVIELELLRQALGGLSLVFDTYDDSVHFAGNLAGDFDLMAEAPLSGDPVELVVSMQNASIEPHYEALQGVIDHSRATGELLILLDIFGDGHVSADLNLEALELTIDDRRFYTQRPIRTSFFTDSSGAHLDVDDLTIGADEDFVTVTGEVNLGEESNVNLSAGGDLNFSLLRLVPALIVDADGVADIGLKLSGPLDSPSLRGRLSWLEARVAPRGLGTSVYLDEGSIRVSEERLTIPEGEPLTGQLFGGDFEAYGDIGLRGLLPSSVDMNVFFTTLQYRVPETLNVTLTGDVNFVARELEDFDTWDLSGAIELVDGRFYQNFDIVSDSLAFGEFGRSDASFALPVWMRVEALNRMGADLVITGRDRFFVQNRIAGGEMDLEFQTDLEVTGRFGAMNVQGEMEVLDGSRVYYRGRTFNVRQATLFFRGDRDTFGYPMPVLDSELVATIQPCNRQASATGGGFSSTSGVGTNTSTLPTLGADNGAVLLTAYVEGLLPLDLNFRLESTPFYDQRDQLSLILTGCTVDQLTAAQAGAPTLDIVLRPVIDLVERNVEERLDFDDVDLIPTTEGSAGILIQDEVTERFSWALDATVGSADNNRQVIRGEYRLFDWLVLEVQEQTNREENIRIDTGFRFRINVD